MVKIRIGVFETNSSSTHTCVICSKNNYENWSKGTAIYITSKEVLNWASKYGVDESISDNSFIKIEALDKVPAKVIFENRWLEKYYVPEIEKFSLREVWDFFLKVHNEEYIENPDKDLVKIMYALNREILEPEEDEEEESSTESLLEDIDIWSLRSSFEEDIGLCAVNMMFDGEFETDSTEEVIGGQEIIALCQFGYDG